MGYTPTFQPMYEDGWEDLPLETTPIQAEALNNYDEAIEHIEDYLASDESQANLADSYDPDEGTYAVGAYAIYEGTLYKCITAVSEPEDFDSDKWESCLITDEMGHGGGGSDVSITPTLSTGVKIADFEIDGDSGELYAPQGGGGNANIWTGTQAEYEAQASQIADGTLVNITDDEQEVVEGGTIYSTDEQCIGLWTNKKPLYQKTFTGLSISLGQNAWTTLTGVTITNGEDLVKADCYGEYTEQYLLNCTKVHLNSADGSIEIKNIESSTTLTAITLTYTKNTDAPLDIVIGKSTMYIASSDCYSTEEKEVGCAPNGKPLYQKTILHTGAFTGSNDLQAIAHGISNFDEAVSITGFIYDGYETSPSWMPLPRFYTSNAFGISYVTTSDIYIYIPSAFGTRLRNARITIQYTKTTDTAGSGQYTPASGKAVHYSTDEQVIGTWIDGSTLYRKTVNTGSIPNNTDKSIAHGISNLSRVINVCGNAKNTTVNHYIPLPYSQTDVTYQVAIYCDNTNIHLITSRDMSGYNESYVTIEYIKSV